MLIFSFLFKPRVREHTFFCTPAELLFLVINPILLKKPDRYYFFKFCMLFCVMIVGVKLNRVWYFIPGYIDVYYAKIRAFRFGISWEMKKVIFLNKKDIFQLIALRRQAYLDLCEYITILV